MNTYLPTLLGTCAWRLEQGEAWWSPTLYELLGRDPSEGPPTLDSFLARIPSAEREALAVPLRAGALQTIETSFRLRHFRTGTLARYTFLGRIGEVPGGTERMLAGVLQRSKPARGAAEAETGVLRLAVETAGLGIWRLHLVSGRLEWNDQLLAIYGLTRAQFEEDLDGWRRMVHPEDAAVADERLGEAAAGTAVYDVSFRIIRQSGEVRHLEASAVPVFRHGELVELIGINVDVTHRVQTDRALRERERMHAALIENSLAAIMVADDEGNYLSVNPAAAELFGIPLERLQKMNVAQLGIEGRPDPEQRYRRFVEAGRGAGEISFVRGDGSRRLAEYRAARVSDGVHVSVLMDITDQRRAEARGRSSERLEALGRLAGGVAHDFNNLLTVIQGGVHCARELPPSSSELALVLDDIQQASERAAELVSQLLAFSRREPSQPRWVDVNHLLRELRRMLARVLGEHIEIELDLWEEARPVWFGESQLSQVVMNLALNARDAMPDGGMLRLRTGDASLATEELWGVESDAPDQTLVLVVEDTGEGMDAATRERIFEPFFTTKSQGRGTGLGLASVYGIVHGNGGVIRVQSAPGEGARFLLGLRMLSVEEGQQASPEPSRPDTSMVEGAERRILVVEDQPALQRMVARLLRRAGYQAMCAGHGEEALALIESTPEGFDLVLSDLMMPVMGGRELGEALASRAPELPVLYMTGYAEAADEPLSGRLLHKPFRVQDLLGAIEETLAAP